MINVATPGFPGSQGNPMDVGQLEELISKANGNAEVKVNGFLELSPIDMVTMENGKYKELVGNVQKSNISEGLRINHSLKKSLSQSLKDVERKPKKMFEDRERGLFIALDMDDKLWILEKGSWSEIKEPSFPDLPKKEIK